MEPAPHTAWAEEARILSQACRHLGAALPLCKHRWAAAGNLFPCIPASGGISGYCRFL